MTFMYAPGQICHTGFHGADFAALTRFFGKGIGWGVFEMPESESPYAVIMDAANHGFGGLGVTGPGMENPTILAYVLVDSLDAAKAKIIQNGGKVLGPNVEVPGRGFFALFEAPGGVRAAAWENTIEVPAGLPPYKHERTVGTVVGRPTATSDAEATMKFFEAVFGWTGTPRDSPTGHKVYMWSDNGGDGGVFFPADETHPAGTMDAHILVADIDAAIKNAEGAGGVVKGGKEEFADFAYRAVVQIPGGPSVTLWQDR